MENPPAQANAGRREISIDAVKAQGILKELTRKERAAAKAWHERWSFYSHVREIQEEEAQKLGLSLAEYRAGVRALSCQPEPRRYPVVVDPSPAPVPATSSGMVGRRAQCQLERYGRVVRTARDYPVRPPPPPGQAYDPYKQTSFFLGSIDVGDPISYQLPAASSATPDEAWAQPRAVHVLPLCQEALVKVRSWMKMAEEGGNNVRSIIRSHNKARRIMYSQ